MDEKRIAEELAKIEGIEECVKYEALGGLKTFKCVSCPCAPFNRPDYLNSHDALKRILKTFRLAMLTKIRRALVAIMERDSGRPFIDGQLLVAECPQIAEAILKALGKWEEGE